MTYRYLLIGTLLGWTVACGGEPDNTAATDNAEASRLHSTAAQPQVTSVPTKTADLTPGKQVDYAIFGVLGLEVGDDIDTVEQKIHANLPDLTITRAQMDISNVPGSVLRGVDYDFSLSAVSLNAAGQRRPYGQSIIATFTPPPGTPRLIGLLRTNPFEKQRVRSDIAAQFIEKYGQPAYSDKTLMSWSVDAQGAPIRDVQRLRQCQRAGNTRGRLYMNDMRASSQYRGPYANCGFTFMAIFQADNNPELVRGFNTLMYDIDLLTEHSDQTIAYTQTEAEKLREAEVQAARDVQGEAPTL